MSEVQAAPAADAAPEIQSEEHLPPPGKFN